MKYIQSTIRSLLLCTLLVIASAVYSNAQVVTDFNGNADGALSGQNTSLSTGLAAGTWANGGTPVVTATADLTNTYAITQNGTGKVLRSTGGNVATTAATYASLASPLSGTVYFSLLTQWNDNSARSGLTFNTASNSINGGFTLLTVANSGTTDLRFRVGSTDVATFDMNNSLSAVNFYVGTISFTGGNETLSVWVNPDISSGSIAGAANLIYSGADLGSDLNTIGVLTYGLTTTSYIDNVRFGNALTDVAVIPEPSTYVLLIAACVWMWVLRRRRA